MSQDWPEVEERKATHCWECPCALDLMNTDTYATVMGGVICTHCHNGLPCPQRTR